MWVSTARLLGASPIRSARQVGAGLDLARSTGLRYLARRRREHRAWVGLGAGPAHAVYREIWAGAAQELGAELLDLGSGFLQLRSGDARTRVWMQWVELEDIVTHRLSLDKTRVHELLAAAGVPVPEYVEFGYRETEQALDFIEGSPGPCVVKPASGTSGGGGVTSGVRTRANFLRARLRSSRADARLLAERQVAGDAYRLLVFDGELLDAVHRRPPTLRGDGRSSVADLIAKENRRRLAAGGWQGFTLLNVDLDAILALERQGIGLRSVPEEAAEVVVKGVESQNSARENETVRVEVAPDLVREVAGAARAVGLRLAGIDLVAPDLSRSLSESGGAVIEVNGTPGFQYHYLVAEPERATPVAVPVLRTLLDERH